MTRSEFLGAKASNAGDSFHELWALHAALELLKPRTTLIAVTVEGVRAVDTATANLDAWSGVDCGLYFGGDAFATASRVELIQLKYSTANPDKNWTVAGLTISSSKTRGNSVIRRLANQFNAAHPQRRSNPNKETIVRFVSNRPVAPEVTSALASINGKHERPRPKSAQRNLEKLRIASGLKKNEFADFCRSLVMEGGVDSRFALKEELLISIGKWTNTSSRTQLDDLLQFVRDHMMPESRRDLIRRESILSRFGVSDIKSIFPCPPDLKLVERLVSRSQASQVTSAIERGAQRICLHGEGGCGKTTLLQEIRRLIPEQSNMIVFDCYGGGTYLDSNAYRHRERDAFTQLVNEIASVFGAPLFLQPSAQTDYPRVFMDRLIEAAALQRLVAPRSALIIAIDAADNSVSAAKACKPPQESFISSVAKLGVLPDNVAVIITARTGRLDSLELPATFERIPVAAFSLSETAAHVTSYRKGVIESWIQEFHELSSHNPRVQSYALDISRRSGNLADSMRYLLPSGKVLNDVFRKQLQDAIVKSGSNIDVQRFCAAVVALPRPIPLEVLASITNLSSAHISDICRDLSPGIIVGNNELSLADEDFEGFLGQESRDQVKDLKSAIAHHLWTTRNTTIYAATHVAASLLEADRGSDLVTLLQSEKEPSIITDPVLRREVQLQRLKLGIRICDELKAPVDAIKTLVIGTEAISTDDVIRRRLEHNPHLAAVCSAERASTLVLRDPNAYPYHGGLLFHLYSQDARHGNLLQARARQRQLDAWMKRRSEALKERDDKHYPREEWPIEVRDIAASIEADLLLYGPAVAIRALRSWSPRLMLPALLCAVSESILSSGKPDLAVALYSSEDLLDAWKVFVYVPCALAGLSIPLSPLVRGLISLAKRASGLLRNRSKGGYEDTTYQALPELLLRGCELSLALGCPFQTLQHVLAIFEDPFQRSREHFSTYNAHSLDRTFRALSLRIRMGGRPLTEETFWVTAQESQSGNARRSEERKREQDAYVNPLCAAYSTRAEILLGITPNLDSAQAIRDMQGKAKLSDYTIHRQYEAGRVRTQFAASLAVLLPVRAMDPSKLMEASIAIVGNQARFTTKDHLDALGSFRIRPELHEAMLSQVNSWTVDLSSRKIPASERIDSMVHLAGFVLKISSASAGAMFIKSLEFAGQIDEDVLLQIQVLGSLAGMARSKLSSERRNELGRDMICVAGDAILRLDDLRDYDWQKFARVLTQLNPALALALAARWEDYGIVRRDQLLPSMVREGLKANLITAGQACALIALVDNADPALLEVTFDSSKDAPLPYRIRMAEILSWDDLFRFGRGLSSNLAQKLRAEGYVGNGMRWAKSLDETVTFVAASRERLVGNSSGTDESSSGLSDWKELLTFDSSEGLRDAIKKAEDEAEERGGHLRYNANYIFNSVFDKVPVGKRVHVLSGLCELFTSEQQLSADSQLVRALDRWRSDPAVEEWCSTTLPKFVCDNILRLGRWVRYERSVIYQLLQYSRINPQQITNLILSGLASNAEDLSAHLVLPLVELLAGQLGADDAVTLSQWYSARLVDQIPLTERDLIDPHDVPTSSSAGVARYIYAMMTDVDTRIRWKAAYAFCRLAILGESETIAAFSAEHTRTSDSLFRQPGAPFYELGAKLWLTVALDRACGEAPNNVAPLASDLRKMVDGSSTPHVLIRAFARSSLLKLADAGAIFLTKADRATLMKIDKSPLKAKERLDVSREGSTSKQETRHHFDWVDTIPYWYRPVVDCFADLTMGEFLTVADKWVTDKWGVPPDIGVWKDEKRLNRYPEREWGLWSNGHGSKPVIERPSLYYEWHAMWCTVGELLATRPLAVKEADWSDDNLDRRIRRAMLTDPPTWLSQLRMAKPLEARFWSEPSNKENIDSWLTAAGNSDFFSEIGIAPEVAEIVVDGGHETQAYWFRSTVHIRSAMVTPGRAASLLRALETADHYQYLVPPEEHRLEIDSDGYKLLGWLKSRDSEGEGIDNHDMFRASVNPYGNIPGTAVSQHFNIGQQFTEDGLIFGDNDEPIFVRELWSDETDQTDRRHNYDDRPISKGERLKMNKSRLREFLATRGLDLIVHVELTRANRGYGYGESSDKEKKQTCNRHFVLRSNRIYEDAFGGSGTW